MYCCSQRKWIHEVRIPFDSSLRGLDNFIDLGYRIYTRLSPERVKELAEDRREAGGRVDVHSITPEELLVQTNKVFAPYTVRFAAPLSWFAIWKGWFCHNFRPSLPAPVS